MFKSKAPDAATLSPAGGAKPGTNHFSSRGDQPHQGKYFATIFSEKQRVAKNLLQQYAQSQKIDFPIYTTRLVLSDHGTMFASKVSVNGINYKTVTRHQTAKEAEQAVALVACRALAIDDIEQEKTLYKSVLQELAVAEGLHCPVYETHVEWCGNQPKYKCTVEIGVHKFAGSESNKKKLAEGSAAKAAVFTLSGRKKLPTQRAPCRPAFNWNKALGTTD